MFNNEIWVVLAGDKGGGYVTFHVKAVNSINSGSVDNVHLYTMFEGADTLENMWKIDLESNIGNESVGHDGQRKLLQRSMVLSEENQELEKIGGDVIEIENRIGRMKLYYKGSMRKMVGETRGHQGGETRKVFLEDSNRIPQEDLLDHLDGLETTALASRPPRCVFMRLFQNQKQSNGTFGTYFQGYDKHSAFPYVK
eukprot:gene9881-18470_t